MQIFKKQKWLQWAILILLHLLLMSCRSPQSETPSSNNNSDECALVQKGRFAHRWWEYYERGVEFHKKGEPCFLQAENCYREAIRQRDDDRWNIRTFGMHSTDYFPNRELGMLLYYLWKNDGAINNNLLEEAESYLKASYSTAKSMKTAFYLNKVREKLFEDNKEPPVIIITTPDKSISETNAFSVTIKGKAVDDHFVHKIFMNDDEIPTDVSDKEISFEKTVTLTHGKKDFTFSAKDFAGNESLPIKLTINVDLAGPVIALSDEFDSLPDEGEIQLSGQVFDNTGIKEIDIDGRVVMSNNTTPLETNISIREEVQYSAKKRSTFMITATDKLGNKTTAKFKPRKKEMPTYFSMNQNSPTVSDSDYYSWVYPSEGHDDIKLDYYYPRVRNNESIKTYHNEIFLHGVIESTLTNLDKIEIVVDSETLADIQQQKNPQGKLLNRFYFSKFIPLLKEDSTIKVTCQTIQKAPNKKQIHSFSPVNIKYRKPTIFKSEKANILLRKAKDSDKIKNLIDNFYKQKEVKKRFAAEKEGNGAQKNKYYDYIVSIDKLDTYDTTILDFIHFKIRIFEIIEGNDKELSDFDIYGYAGEPWNMENRSKVLYAKMVTELPQITGNIKSVDFNGRRFETDLSKETSNVKTGMKITVFKREHPPGSGKIVPDYERIASARIEKVKNSSSTAKIREGKDIHKIKEGYCVITK